MKKTLIVATILMLTACSSKLGIEQVMKDSISEDRQITQVISNRGQLKSDKLKKEIQSLNSLNGQDSQEVWNKIQTDFDFSKYSILIYTVRQASICEYNEKFVKKDAQQIDIILVQSNNPDAICMDASVNYYLVYKVSKEIKRVGIKAFRYDYVVVEMK